MFCPNCQKEISNESVFCCFCGTVTKQPETPQTNTEISQTNIKNEENTEKQNQFYVNDNRPPVQSHTYSTPQKDPGETDALLAFIFGIISFFFGPVFAIISLVFVKEYHKNGNGSNETKVKAGKIVSIISLIFVGLSFLAIIFFYGFIFFVAMFGAAEIATIPLA